MNKLEQTAFYQLVFLEEGYQLLPPTGVKDNLIFSDLETAKLIMELLNKQIKEAYKKENKSNLLELSKYIQTLGSINSRLEKIENLLLNKVGI